VIDIPSSRARTVAYVAWAPFFSGAERALLMLIEGLDTGRYRPFVITSPASALTARLRDRGVPGAEVPIQWTDWRHPLRWGAAVLRAARLARRAGAVVVHANEAPSFHVAGYAARLLGVPAVAHVRFADGDFRWFLKPPFARALFVSQYLHDQAVADHPGFFDGRAEVVHDGVDLPRLPSPAECLVGRRALGVPEDGPAVLLAGQVAEVKGIWEYIEAGRRLVAAGVRGTFVVMGDDFRGRGALRRAAEARVRTLGLDHRFRFLGFRPNASELVAHFDIVAVPSHVEPLGNATLEAMAAGRPVVASRVGGIPEMVVDGETGLLVPPRDPSALATALRALIDHPGMRERMGAAARHRAESMFSVSRHATRVQEIYDRLLDVAEGAQTADRFSSCFARKERVP
jgi:glycosyltransferase involved in cell wall biosynthesis